MDKQSVKAFLERQIEINQKKYERLSSIMCSRNLLKVDARQTEIEKCRSLEMKLYHLQVLSIMLGLEKKNNFNGYKKNQLKEMKWSALEFIQSEIMDCQDELIELEGIIREEFWETEEEKQRTLDDKRKKKEELKHWKYLKEFLNNF